MRDLAELGEVRYGCDIGIKSNGHFIWIDCSDCGKERWVRMLNGEPKDLLCNSCIRKGVAPFPIA